MTREKPHHHGNLRAALVAAGVALVEDGGAEALTIRKTAARAGVSHAAPAHHFPHLGDLRAAVIAEGYRRFRTMMEAEIARAPDTPRAAILAAGRGYIGFAMQHPGLFHLMFGGSAHDHKSPELIVAADAAYDVLRRISAPLAPGPAGATGNEILVWSIMHGFAGLVLANHGREGAPDDPLALFEQIFPDLPLADPAPDATP